ncbi:uncharacterized protein LOC122663066 [Telopea speciosissima]|uniref:uncharacterized protein LOC122663066 n=1 Tax=Telopea speciosissima TaxID=54955 RepID=UPI001CC73604|nr:uncharacterized protein LOC122663066 [Telopea speciosissima]
MESMYRIEETLEKYAYKREKTSGLCQHVYKVFISKESDDSSSDSEIDEDSDSAISECLFMAYRINKDENQPSEETEEMEVVVDLEGELEEALEKLDIEKKKNKKLVKVCMKQEKELESLKDSQTTLNDLKTQLAFKVTHCNKLAQENEVLQSQIKEYEDKINNYELILGHLAKNCKQPIYFSPIKKSIQKKTTTGSDGKKQVKKVWIGKVSRGKSINSLVVQTAFRAQDKAVPWILDSGCSSHKTGDKYKFAELNQYEGGSVKFGNSESTKIVGKRIVHLDDGKVKTSDVLYVSGLKHNLLSIS